jgi:hypothetical protein
MVNTQYSIVKHIDKEHLHLHLIANKVNKMGKAIKDGWIGLRSKKVCEALTLKYEMRQGLGKNLKLTQMAALNKYDATKYKIYAAVSEMLPTCKNFSELKEQLRRLEIGMRLKYSSQQEQLQGISFKMGDYCFKGSDIDRGLSVKKLEIMLEINYNQNLKQELKLHL